MSVSDRQAKQQAALGRRLLHSPKALHEMKKQQNAFTYKDSVIKICDLIEEMGR